MKSVYVGLSVVSPWAGYAELRRPHLHEMPGISKICPGHPRLRFGA